VLNAFGVKLSHAELRRQKRFEINWDD